MRRRTRVRLTSAGLAALALALPAAAADGPLLGFIGDRSAAHRALESRFDRELQADNLREWMRYLSGRPHHVGAPFGKEIADFLAALSN